MPNQIKERLRVQIDKSVGILGIFGWGSLIVVSLALPDFRGWPQFLSQFNSVQDAVDFFRPKIPAILLIGTTIFWFYRYKGAVTNELGQINDIFEEEHAPKYFGNIEEHQLIPLIGYLIVGTYCALVLAAPHIFVYCLIALVLHITDLTGSTIVLQNLHRTLTRFPIVTKTPAVSFIAERRDALIQYYFGNRTLPRIGILTIVTAGALTLSLMMPANWPEFARYIPYALMIANILIGEYVIGRWRAKRDRKLDEIAIREEYPDAMPSA
jgi:hypothetical protein